MATSAVRFSELPFQAPIGLYCPSSFSSFRLFRFGILSTISSSSSSSSSIRISHQNPSPSPKIPWIDHWDPPPKNPTPSGGDAIGRIVHRLRNLGLGLVDEDEEEEEDGNEKLGDLLNSTWTRPNSPAGPAQTPLPWDRGRRGNQGDKGDRRRRVKAPTLAELTIEDEELRRLRRLGMMLRERINIPKAGATREVVGKIHDGWRRSELVRLKFHETLAHDMKTAHELVEGEERIPKECKEKTRKDA